MTTKAIARGLSCLCVLAPHCVTAGVNAWTPVGPDGGRVYDVEFSQTSPGTYYAVGRWGVYRSTVDTDSFELLKEDFERPPFDLAVDPTRADRVLVAAEGLQVGAGATWTRYTTVLDQGAKVRTSLDGSTTYFAAGVRIFRSQDRGTSWQERTALPGAPAGSLVNALEIDPSSSDVVYANTFGLGLFVSTDGGGAWQRVGATDPAIIRILNFVVDPSNPQRLLAATNDAGLRVSNDGGVTWNATNVTGQIWDVDVDPRDPRVIYASGPDIRKSVDNGLTWQVLTVDQPSGTLRLVIDPVLPSRLAAFNGEGVSISTDAGATWSKRIVGLRGTRPAGFSPLATSRRNYLGVNDRGVYYVDAGESLARSVNNDPLFLLATPPGNPYGVRVLALPGNGDTLYAVLNSQVLAQSIDAGLHWTKLASPAIFINAVAASPLEPRTLYAGGFPAGVYKSLDGGASWAASAAGLPDQLDVTAIAIASTPATLYAIGVMNNNNGTSPSQWGMWRSNDGGVTWSVASPLETRQIVSVTVDPNDAQVVYAGFENELRKSTDGGATWTTATRNGTPLCCRFGGVVFDPTDSNVYYAQHMSGVWRTVDAGASWERVEPPFRIASTDSVGALALDSENRHRLLMGWSELGVRELTIAPDLQLTMTAPTALAANEAAGVTLTVRNNGPFDASNVRVTAQLPAGATGASVAGAGAACTLAATTATCVFAVVRTSGSAAISLSFVPASLPVTLSTSVTGDEPDSFGANNAASKEIGAAAPSSGGGGGGGGAISLSALMALMALASLRMRQKRR